MSTKMIAYVRLKKEDKMILRKLATYYDVSESDALTSSPPWKGEGSLLVKITIKHLAKELGLLSS